MSRANRSPQSDRPPQQETPSNQGGSRKRRRRPSKRRRSALGLIFVVTAILTGVLAVFAVLFVVPTVRVSDPSLEPVEAVGLSVYLLANQSQLSQPVDSNAAPARFEIVAGQGAVDIAQGLLAQGYITDADLFRRYARFYGFDRRFEAGVYEISASMNIPELVVALVEADPVEVSIRIPEAWRREQVAAWIDTQPQIPFSGSDYLQATDSVDDLPEGSSLVSVIPQGQTLEGFLYPDTYRLDVDAAAEDLVERMVLGFENRVTEQTRVDGAATGYSLYQIVTLASIVEREAAIAAERPQIASVYLNRLAIDMMLQADPTVQYAQGYIAARDEWWNTALTQADYSVVVSPYNTYLNNGLPPGPIANPVANSIEAVVYPEETPYFFFRAACDGSGLHNFAVTFEEHLANACP